VQQGWSKHMLPVARSMLTVVLLLLRGLGTGATMNHTCIASQ
jgi:hypothetical protein